MSERICSLLIVSFSICLSLFVAVSKGFEQEYTLFFVIIFLESILALVGSHCCDRYTIKFSLYRPNASSSIFLVLLTPLSLLAELASTTRGADQDNLLKEVSLSLGSTLAILVLCLHLTKQWGKPAMAVTIVTAVLLSLLFLRLPPILFAVETVLVAMITRMFIYIPAHLPRSFTQAELAVLLQLISTWLCRVIFALFQDTDTDNNLPWFVCTLVISVSLATITIWRLQLFNSVIQFFITYALFAVGALVFLHFTLTVTPILWLFYFIQEGCMRISLLVTWTILLLITLIWTTIHSMSNPELGTPQSSHPCVTGKTVTTVKQEFSESGDQTQKRKKDFEMQANIVSRGDEKASHDVGETDAAIRLSPSLITRKLFHLFIVLVYLPGLLFDVKLLLLASAAALGFFIILEATRAFRVPYLGQPLDDIMRTFVDDRDQGLVFLTHFYLLIGLSLPLWMSHKVLILDKGPIEMYSGLLSLGIGDTLACVAGKKFGRIKWPGTYKTVEGTAFSVLSQIALVVAGAYMGEVTVRSISLASVGIVLGALIEAFTDQIDNLILPLVLFPMLCMI